MPSNKDLIKEANELAGELGIPIDTKGLKNDDLAALVSDLKAKKRDAELTTQADGDAPAPDGDILAPDGDVPALDGDAPALDGDVKKFPFSVAEGKALTSKRGILKAGDEVKAEDVSGGQETIDKRVESGHIVKG